MHQEYKYSSLNKDNFKFDRVYEDLQIKTALRGSTLSKSVLNNFRKELRFHG